SRGRSGGAAIHGAADVIRRDPAMARSWNRATTVVIAKDAEEERAEDRLRPQCHERGSEDEEASVAADQWTEVRPQPTPCDDAVQTEPDDRDDERNHQHSLECQHR